MAREPRAVPECLPLARIPATTPDTHYLNVYRIGPLGLRISALLRKHNSTWRPLLVQVASPGPSSSCRSGSTSQRDLLRLATCRTATDVRRALGVSGLQRDSSNNLAFQFVFHPPSCGAFLLKLFCSYDTIAAPGETKVAANLNPERANRVAVETTCCPRTPRRVYLEPGCVFKRRGCRNPLKHRPAA